MASEARLSILKSFCLVLCLTATSCGGNLFEEASVKNSEDSILQEIQKAVNELRFDDAILLITENPSLVPESRENKMLFASAYAGKCGVTFTQLIDSVGNATGTPILTAMISFASTATTPAACVTAQGYLEDIGANSARTTNENIALFLLGFAKVGVYLKPIADAAAPFGAVDPGFDGCTGGNLPESNVKQMMSGLALMVENYDAVSSYLSIGLGADLTSIESDCGAACTETDASAISDPTAIEIFRRLIESNEYGVGNCAFLLCC